MLAEFAAKRWHTDAEGKRYRVMKPQSYCRFYEELFGPIRAEVKMVLEIGVYKGGSLLMWEQFFPNATIVGVDIRKWCVQYEGGRRKVVIGNQHDPELLARLVEEFGQFDIIVDDGSHHWEDQRFTFWHFFDKLWRFYAVEDVHTSYVEHDWKYYSDEPNPKPFTDTVHWILGRMHCTRLTERYPAYSSGDKTLKRVITIPGLIVFEKDQPA